MANLKHEVEEAQQETRAAGSFQPEFESDNERYAAVRRVLRVPREQCVEEGKWYAYVEYFDPKWHYEDWRMLELEKLRQEQAKMMADVQQALLTEQAAIAAEHARTAEAHKAIFERSERQATWFQRAFIALAIVALTLALAPLAYPNGVAWLVDHAPGVERSVTPPPQSTPDTEASPP